MSRREHELALDLAALEPVERLRRLGEREHRVDRGRELAVGDPREDLRARARGSCAGSRIANEPQNTPTIWQPLSSTRLSGIFGISPDAKPTTR